MQKQKITTFAQVMEFWGHTLLVITSNQFSKRAKKTIMNLRHPTKQAPLSTQVHCRKQLMNIYFKTKNQNKQTNKQKKKINHWSEMHTCWILFALCAEQEKPHLVHPTILSTSPLTK